MSLVWRAPIAFRGLAEILGSCRERSDLLGRLRRLPAAGEAILVGDPGDPTVSLLVHSTSSGSQVEVLLEQGSGQLTHPLSRVLPDTLPRRGMVDTVRWPDARMVYVDPGLHGPRVLGRRSKGHPLEAYLARVFTGPGAPAGPAQPVDRRYVEPGVGRSYLVDFLSFTGRPEFHDFSVSGAGASPYCRAGYLLPGSVADGNMPMIRARHRHEMAVRLDEAGLRVPRTAALIDLPGREHLMHDGSHASAAMLVRGFRTVLRVKQLDPVANLLMSRPWWREIQQELDGADPAQPGGRRQSGADACSCYVPSVLLGTWPGRRCDPLRPCHQRRWERMREESPAVLEVARERLALEDGYDEPLPLGVYVTRFAGLLGAQLAGLREARVLHDYRVLRGPWADSRSVINSLGDTNVTLAAELADLDTAIAVDDPGSEAALLITRAERLTLRARFAELHDIEVGLAEGICRTVATIALPESPAAAGEASQAFTRSYGRALVSTA